MVFAQMFQILDALAVQADKFRIADSPSKVFIISMNCKSQHIKIGDFCGKERSRGTPQRAIRVKAPFISHHLLEVARDLNPAVPGAHNPIQPLGPNGQIDR